MREPKDLGDSSKNRCNDIETADFNKAEEADSDYSIQRKTLQHMNVRIYLNMTYQYDGIFNILKSTVVNHIHCFV